MKKYRVTAVLIALGMLLVACGTYTDTDTDDTQLPEASEESLPKNASGSDTDIATYPDRDYADAADERIRTGETSYVRVRGTDEESGDIVDTSIYRADGEIIKIITEDYGSDGRIVSSYYYGDGNVVYMTQYKTDIYGIGSTYTEADLSDPEADYTIGVLEKGEKALHDAGQNKGMALLYGYAGDEQGGVLQNVTVKLRNRAGDHSDETVTDGDGFYSFEVPQAEDTYDLTYTYGSYMVSSLNDVHIVPGTPEYSLGRVYVAPEGQGVHETDVYLMDPGAYSPVSLKDDELAAVIEGDEFSTAALSLRAVNKDDRKYQYGTAVSFDLKKSSSGYSLFVEDTGNLGRDDMSGAMGRGYVRVTIYDKDGIVAAYPVPAGRLGTLWRVCDIDSDGDTGISGIMYTDTAGWSWLE